MSLDERLTTASSPEIPSSSMPVSTNLFKRFGAFVKNNKLFSLTSILIFGTLTWATISDLKRVDHSYLEFDGYIANTYFRFEEEKHLFGEDVNRLYIRNSDSTVIYEDSLNEDLMPERKIVMKSNVKYTISNPRFTVFNEAIYSWVSHPEMDMEYRSILMYLATAKP